MKFDSDYWHSLDRRYIDKLNVSASTLGISTPPMRDQLESLKTRIFQGASQIELGFMGRGKGSMGQGAPTPEMYGNEEREAIRQLARINEVETSTHVAPNVQGFAGLGERGFTDEAKEQNLMEVKRTIDFAADVARGGPVVMHTGEFPRPVSKYKEFEAYPEEEDRQIHYLVNKKTGEIKRGVREDEEIYVPREKGALKDQYGNDKKITFFGKEIPVMEYQLDENGNMLVDPIKFKDFKNDPKYIGKYQFKKGDNEAAAKAFYEETKKAEQFHALGQADEYEIMYKDALETRQKILESLSFYEKLEKVPGIDKEKLKREVGARVHFIPPEEVEPTKYLKDQLREWEKRMNYGQEIAISARKNVATIQEEIDDMIPIHQYGIKESADTLARAGIYALQKEKESGLDRPLFIAPENIFPENGYASHPAELKELILKSRERMVERLWDKEKGEPSQEAASLGIYNRKEAEKAAEDHIKITFDIGHLNTWKKYFKGTTDNPDKEFKEWMMQQVDSLNKEKMIGHVHISDNFGYYDEHVDPGEGNVPIPEFVKKMMESGYKGKMIIEPAHQDIRAWTKFMSNFASPVYRTKLWSDDDMGFFKGRTYSPSYIVGGYSPDSGTEETDWRFWSGIRLE